MKKVAAILVALAIFVLVWFLLAYLLWAIAQAAVSSIELPRGLLALHVLGTWVLSPGVAAGVAVFAASNAFPLVSVNLVYRGLIWAIVILLAPLLTVQIVGNFFVDRAISETVILLLQLASILGGGAIGKHVAAA